MPLFYYHETGISCMFTLRHVQDYTVEEGDSKKSLTRFNVVLEGLASGLAAMTHSKRDRIDCFEALSDTNISIYPAFEREQEDAYSA